MTKKSKKTLVAVDFHEGNEILLDKARKLADLSDSELVVVHVIEPLPDAVYANAIANGTPMEQHVSHMLTDLLKPFDIAPKNQFILKGSVTTQLIEFIQQHKVELLLVGSHGRGRFMELLGSSARGIIHHSPCDVLVVKMKA